MYWFDNKIMMWEIFVSTCVHDIIYQKVEELILLMAFGSKFDVTGAFDVFRNFPSFLTTYLEKLMKTLKEKVSNQKDMVVENLNFTVNQHLLNMA